MADSASNAPEAFVFYKYKPSMAAAVIFIMLFIAATSVHIFQMIKHKAWFFTAFIIGGCFEFIGYGGRAKSSQESPKFTTGPYVIQSLLLLLGPSFFAASIYMILGRIIRLTDGESHSIIRTRWLTIVFVSGDIISFLVQAAGGGMLATAKTQSMLNTLNNVVLLGLILQVLFFGFFVIVASIFHKRIRAVPTGRSSALKVPWERYLVILYLASAMIMVRCVFRIAEYAGGQDGKLLSTELYLYIFDATLMFLVMVIFSVQHPSMVINRTAVSDYRMDQLNS